MKVGLVVAAGLAPLALLACGGDGSSPPDDETIGQIAGVAELATNAYASVGPEGLYEYLTPEVAQHCSKEALGEALKDQPVPDGFRRIARVKFEGENVRATVVQLFGRDDTEVEWTFVAVAEKTWRITHVPGLERCRS